MSSAAFLFPGQGAQTVGMGRAACEAVPAIRQLFDNASRILGYDLAELCFHGPAERLDSTVYSQPALFVCGLAGLEVLRARSPQLLETCQATAGLSLGEYTAMVLAEVLTFADALRVVQRRGEAMQAAADAVPSGMVSILGLDGPAVERLCDEQRSDGEILQIANYLCPGNIVISGHRAACQRAAEAAAAAGAMKAIPLQVAGAFHTPLMESAVGPLSDAIAQVELRPARIPVISNVDARPHQDPEEIRELLIRQVVAPVRWEDSMRYLLDSGCPSFLEIGPGRVLRGLLKRIDRKIPAEGIEV